MVLTPQVTDAEIKHRERMFKGDIRSVMKKMLLCEMCDLSVEEQIKKEGKIITHPLYDVLICGPCHEFYITGEFTSDEEGDSFCRWCGEGGQIYICTNKNCCGGICSVCCVKYQGQAKAKYISRNTKWLCFSCDTKPILKARSISWAVKEYAKLPDSKISKENNASNEGPSDFSNKVFKDLSNEVPKDSSDEADKDTSNEVPKDSSDKVSKESSSETAKDPTYDISRDSSCELSNDFFDDDLVEITTPTRKSPRKPEAKRSNRRATLKRNATKKVKTFDEHTDEEIDEKKVNEGTGNRKQRTTSRKRSVRNSSIEEEDDPDKKKSKSADEDDDTEGNMSTKDESEEGSLNGNIAEKSPEQSILKILTSIGIMSNSQLDKIKNVTNQMSKHRKSGGKFGSFIKEVMTFLDNSAETIENLKKDCNEVLNVLEEDKSKKSRK